MSELTNLGWAVGRRCQAEIPRVERCAGHTSAFVKAALELPSTRNAAGAGSWTGALWRFIRPSMMACNPSGRTLSEV